MLLGQMHSANLQTDQRADKADANSHKYGKLQLSGIHELRLN